ncbi:hypothetical protein Hanom_Chr05g00394221 [Helianthus anomalus]
MIGLMCIGIIGKKMRKRMFGLKDLNVFLCRKHETVNELEERYGKLLDSLKRYEIRLSNAEKISKFADALPSEWDEFLIKLKQDSRFSKFYLKEFTKELKIHDYEINKKKKNLINDIEKNLDKISLDVILEINRRINIFLAAKNVKIYDIKSGCYIDKNINPLHFD